MLFLLFVVEIDIGQGDVFVPEQQRAGGVPLGALGAIAKSSVREILAEEILRHLNFFFATEEHKFAFVDEAKNQCTSAIEEDTSGCEVGIHDEEPNDALRLSVEDLVERIAFGREGGDDGAQQKNVEHGEAKHEDDGELCGVRVFGGKVPKKQGDDGEEEKGENAYFLHRFAFEQAMQDYVSVDVRAGRLGRHRHFFCAKKVYFWRFTTFCVSLRLFRQLFR